MYGLGLAVDDSIDINADISAASWLLWSLSGRQFSGGCIETVRPCRTQCSWWNGVGSLANGVNLALAGADWWFGWGGGGWGWYGDDRTQACGCGGLSQVALDGYPVTSITEVLINGDTVDPSTYRLDAKRYLVRIGEDDNGQRLHWPACQALWKNPDQDGTWQVTYEYGTQPPELGRLAAAELALQFFYSRTGNAKCKLPAGVTKVVRQGITITRLVPLFQMGKDGGTGIPLVDGFLQGSNPNGLRRRPAVMSPGVPRYPRRTTT